MQLQIREIILWPRSVEEPPRRVQFKLGTTNIITGASKTGKSAIIPIIDYCLGADTCSIPVNTIRNSCSWFGVLLETELGQKLIARKEPGSQRSTRDMYVVEAAVVEIPNKILLKNTSVEAVKQRLNELAGLSQLDFTSAEVASSFRGRPSFRDMVAFVFQPQNVVANPNVLFFKADTYEHQEKLRTIFPYVLGAVTPLTLAKQHELLRLRAELKRKENELSVIREVSERWVAEIKSKVSSALEFGLLSIAPTKEAPLEDLIELLRGVSIQSSEPRISTITVTAAVSELSDLTREERELSVSLSLLRRRFADMSELREASGEYGQALGVKRDRLRVADWLNELYEKKGECLLCGSEQKPHAPMLASLYKSLKEVEVQAGDFQRMPAAFDREFDRIRSEIGRVAEQLEGIQTRRRTLERRSNVDQQESYSQLAIARFIGELQEALRRYERVGTDGDLVDEVANLKGQVRSLEIELKSLDIRNATARALLSLTAYMGRLIPQLDIERPNDAVTLSIDDLSVKVTAQDREDYLWEIGSGANWVGYHLAVTLGLQNLFFGLRHSPVPSFVVYDQPSQVYFPKRLVEKSSLANDEVTEAKLEDEDIAAVKKIFKLIASETQKHEGKMQSIVLDHAASDVWGSIDGIYEVEEWRLGTKLVPESWEA